MTILEASYCRVKAWKVLPHHCLLQVLIRYRNIWNIDINYKPIFMGGLTTASGNFKNKQKSLRLCSQDYKVVCRTLLNYIKILFKSIHVYVFFSGNHYLSTMAECPNKAAYQFMDLEKRTAKFFNIPFKMSSDPFNRIGKYI